MRHTTVLVASLLIALACGSANAQWKWRDDKGRVTASDLPPPNTVAEGDILSRPTDARRAANSAKAAPPVSTPIGKAPAATAKASTDPELEARRKRAADEQSAQERQLMARNAAASAENCSRARAYLAVLNDGRRMTRTNAQGEIEVVDDKGRAEELQRARATISSECK